MTIEEKDSENRFGAMDQSMKDFGHLTWPTGKEDSSTLVVISMKVNGLTVSPMDMEGIYTTRDLRLKENGNRINNLDMELKLGQMAQDSKAITNLEGNMELVPFTGLMDPTLWANFLPPALLFLS